MCRRLALDILSFWTVFSSFSERIFSLPGEPYYFHFFIMEKRGRGRPLGSKNKKKVGEADSQSRLTPSQLRSSVSLSNLAASVEDSDDDVSLSTGLHSLDAAIENITVELKNIRKEFAKALEEHSKLISSLRKDNDSLSKKVKDLEKRQEGYEQQLNKQERISRRSNFRLVGVKQEPTEDCLKIAADILTELGLPNPQIERAHRDGRSVPGRDRHLLVKMSFFQDKVKVMKEARRALAGKGFYIIDDLTKLDLQEKRRWKTQVNELYQQGTRLRFSGGCWRGPEGKPYTFN